MGLSRSSLVLSLLLAIAATACDPDTATTSALVATSEADSWQTAYDGFGRIAFEPSGIVLAPKAATRFDETHAALLLSRLAGRDVRVTLDVTTEEQLRTGSAPNPWECFWLFFNVTHDMNGHVRTNYFAFKPNGVELGRAFNSVDQVFLATANDPKLRIGSRSHWVLTKQGQQVDVTIDGAPALSYSGRAESLFDEPGAIGLYTEDARVRVHSVLIESLVR